MASHHGDVQLNDPMVFRFLESSETVSILLHGVHVAILLIEITFSILCSLLYLVLFNVRNYCAGAGDGC